MYWLPPRFRFRVLLYCALFVAAAAILTGRAVAGESGHPKDSAAVQVIPPNMNPDAMRKLEQNLRRYFELQERLRWMMGRPKRVDETDRLTPVPFMYDWIV